MRRLRDKTNTQGSLYTTPALFRYLEKQFKQQAKGKGNASTGNGRGRGEEDAREDDEFDQLASDLEDAAGGDSAPRSRKKRKSTGGKRIRGSRSTKDRVSKLPADLLESILGYASPGDLLSLSRTNKSLRKFVKSSSRKAVWTEARERVGLPDLEESEMSEMSYAEMVYGRRCQSCGKPAPRMADCFLRVRLCKPCKDERLVKLNNTPNDIHPAAGLCVLRSQQTPTQPSQLANTAQWGLLSSVERVSEKLSALQEKDDADHEAQLASMFNKKCAAGSGSRSRRRSEGDDESEAVGVYCYDEPTKKSDAMGEQVRKYVEKKRNALDPVEKEGKVLFDAVSRIVKEEKEQPKVKQQKEPYPPSERRSELERRVLAFEEGFEANDFAATAWTTSNVVNLGEQKVEDEDWDALKPKLVRLLLSIKQKRLKEELKTAQSTRRTALLSFHERHRGEETLYPLFPDWLFLPSVHILWEPKDAVVDSESWAATLEALDEELADWRVSTRLDAVFLILSRTADVPDDEELDPDPDSYPTEDYSDNYLDEISSALCCSIKGCHSSSSNTFFGSLFDLFAHQHAEHPSLDLSPKSTVGNLVNRFDLPLTISAAVDALTDLLHPLRKLDEGSVDDDDEEEEGEFTVAEVDEIFERHKGLKVCWYDGMTKKGKHERDWRKVFCHIHRTAVATKLPKGVDPALEIVTGGETKAKGKKKKQ